MIRGFPFVPSHEERSFVRSYGLSHYVTTLAFAIQQSHIYEKYIAIFNAYTPNNGFSESCEFRTSAFCMQLFWQLFTHHSYFLDHTNVLSFLLKARNLFTIVRKICESLSLIVQYWDGHCNPIVKIKYLLICSQSLINNGIVLCYSVSF